MATLDKYYEKELRRIAGTADAVGYGKWLGEQKKTPGKEADRARQEAAGAAVRSLVDYGTSGEALARTGLSDDGYADYLRKAAKDAREARIRAIESERASSEREALSGYADYLAQVRSAEGDRLVEAAEELLAMTRENQPKAERIIRTATPDGRAAALLRSIRDKYEYIPSSTTRTDVTSVINRIQSMGYSEERAYNYCRLVGYSDKRAREIASFASADHADINEELKNLFGD